MACVQMSLQNIRMGPKKRLAGAEPPAKRRRTSEVSAANQSSSSSTDETMIVVFIQNITSNILAEPQKQSLAVTKDAIYNEAKKHIGSTKWKLEGKIYKCNIFVDDVLANVGAKRPQRRPLMKWMASPIGANEWGNPNSAYVIRTNCYTHIASVCSKQRGDIIAFPRTKGSGHIGIVSDGNLYISAGDKTVDEREIPSGKPTTIWRYNYNKQ